jgi:hypothetical protein
LRRRLNAGAEIVQTTNATVNTTLTGRPGSSGRMLALALCDGRRTLRELIAKTAAALDADAGRITPISSRSRGSLWSAVSCCWRRLRIRWSRGPLRGWDEAGCQFSRNRSLILL